MKHLGDITQINGATIEPVDVITFGSPCQDLSIAGKREGLTGQQSSLFLQATRIIYEMREASNGEYPTFAIWENVPGAFSSNQGEDFRLVLETLASIASSASAAIPRPAGGKWHTAGTIVADGWSIAWRVFDAQYWGVPQRRRRIALVVDFRDQRAPKILFERESLHGDTAQSASTRQAITKGARGGAADASGAASNTNLNCDLALPINDKATRYKGGGATRNDDGCGNGLGVGRAGDPAPTLTAGDRHAVAAFMAGQGAKAGGLGYAIDIAPTLKGMPSGLNQIPSIFDARGNGDGQTAPTITGDHNRCIGDYSSIVQTVYTIDSFASNSMKSANPHSGFHETALSRCLDTQSADPACNQGGNVVVMAATKSYSVRRLTPLECERLQGYPDGWTDIQAYQKG